VVSSELEHHSNFVPWQEVARRTGATFRAIPVNVDGELMLDELDTIGREGRVKLVTTTLVSNSIGTVVPIEILVRFAREQEALVVMDAAQAAPHRSIDVQALDCDFLAFSGHKMCGPSGIGVLFGRSELLERMSPFQTGGGMIGMSPSRRRLGPSCRTSSRPARRRLPRRSRSARRSTT